MLGKFRKIGNFGKIGKIQAQMREGACLVKDAASIGIARENF